MLREFQTEVFKTRRRKIWLLLCAFLGFMGVLMLWQMSEAIPEDIADGYRRMFIVLPLYNTIFLPTLSAMLASRLCDAEVKGNTLKLLCTMEKKGHIFDMKLLLGGLYLTFYLGAELLMLLGLGTVMNFGQSLKGAHVFYFWAENFLVTFLVLLLQTTLSFFFENQIIPLGVGLVGSFLGLFAWFFPTQIFLKRLLPWGYYSLLCFINYDYNKETRVMTCYDVPFDWVSFGLLLGFLLAGYLICKTLFVRKEV